MSNNEGEKLAVFLADLLGEKITKKWLSKADGDGLPPGKSIGKSFGKVTPEELKAFNSFHKRASEGEDMERKLYHQRMELKLSALKLVTDVKTHWKNIQERLALPMGTKIHYDDKKGEYFELLTPQE